MVEVDVDEAPGVFGPIEDAEVPGAPVFELAVKEFVDGASPTDAVESEDGELDGWADAVPGSVNKARPNQALPPSRQSDRGTRRPALGSYIADW